MLGFLLLVIGTISTVLFLIQLFRGGKYEELVSRLVGEEYTLSELYGVGLMWQETLPILDYTGPLGQYVGKSMALLHEDDYREYYSRVALAKAYTFAHLGISASFLLGPVMFGDATALLIALGGSAAAFVMAYNTITDPEKQVEQIADELTMQLPNMVTKLSLLLNSGMILREAWFYVAQHSEGKMAEYLAVSCDEMQNGRSEIMAIYNFGNATSSKEIKRLSSIIVQGMEKGNAELSNLLSQQASELWQVKRQKMLQKGEEAAAKLLLPTMMMFVGLILVIIVSAMGSASI